MLLFWMFLGFILNYITFILCKYVNNNNTNQWGFKPQSYYPSPFNILIMFIFSVFGPICIVMTLIIVINVFDETNLWYDIKDTTIGKWFFNPLK